MKRPRKNDFPAKIGPKTTVFQGDGPVAGYSPGVRSFNHKNGAPHDGLTTNRQKPGGGPGSSGPIKNVG